MFHLFILGQKIRRVEDKTCLFCAEQESVHHLFYECVVAKKKPGKSSLGFLVSQ
jgi:hypothetical protein